MVKKIESLTPEQEAQMPAWRDKWIDIGLRTGDADFDTFDKYIKVAYEKAGLEFPDCIVRVKSPKIGAQVAAVRSAVDSAVDSAVRSAVDSAVDSAVRSPIKRQLNINATMRDGNYG